MRWRRIIGWGLAVLGILIVVVVVGGVLFLRTAGFQRVAIRTLVEDANASIGGRTEIGNLDFQLSTLTTHLYDITIHGTEAANQPPLLHVDKLTVGLKIVSVLRRKINLRELIIENPVANVVVDKKGKSNLPQASQKQSSGNTNVFDLAVGHVLLTNGVVNYNDAALPVNADLHDLQTEIRFEPMGTRYRGSISYDSGRLRYGAEPTLPHSLDARFSATADSASLDSALLKIGGSSASMRADVTNYNNPSVDGHYDVHIHTQDFAALMQPASAAGDVAISGNLQYHGGDSEPLLRKLSTDGQIVSDELVASSEQGRIDVRHLQGKYQLANGTFRASEVGLDALGGNILTDVEIRNLDTTAEARVRTRLSAISLHNAQQALRTAEVKQVSLSGSADGTIEAAWIGSIKNLRAHADLALKGSAGERKNSSAAVPVDGAIHATYDGPRHVITLRDTSLRIPSASMVAQGEISNHSNLQIQANTSDMHQLAALLAAVRGGQPMAISGTASATANVQGSMQKPRVSAQVSAQNLNVQGSQWSSAKFGVDASSSQVSLRDVVLVNAHQGRASASASVGLRNWAYEASNPISLNLSVQRMSIIDLLRVANMQYPVSGDLTAEVAVHGSQLNPVGKGTARIDNARAYDEPIQHLSANFNADKNSLTSTLDVSMPAGTVNGTVSFDPQTKAYQVRLNPSSIAIEKLQIVQARNLGVAGTVKVSANGQGTIDNPELTATLEVPELQLRDKSLSQIKAQLNVANKHAAVSLNSQVAKSSVQFKGDVGLSGSYYATATIDTTDVPLDQLAALYNPSLSENFHGDTELHATLRGPLKNPSQIEAHLTIPTLKATYQSLEIAAAGPIRADYANSVVTLQPSEIRGTGTSLRVQGRIPLQGNTAPTLAAQGSVDMRILQIVAPDVHSSGTVALDVHSSGTSKDLAVQGQVHLQDIAVSTPSAPLGLRKLNGTLDIINNSLQITNVAGEVGGGQVSLGGSISYKPDLQFNVTLQSKSVRLRYPDGLRTVLDGNLILSGTKDASTLNGRVLIDTLSFTPDFDLAKFSDQFGGNTVPAQPGIADTVKLAVSLQSKNNLSATSSQVSVEGQVNLQVVGTAANPVIIGRTDLTAGELFYRNVRYQLERGIITFDNPVETQPTLNVTVATTVEQYNLTLTLRGPFDKLTTSYTSDPPLATADIINLVANGKTTQEANAAGQSTDSMIASQVAGEVTGGIQHLAGISSLQIDPLLGGNNSNPSARVAIQQRVTKNFLFTFSTDLSQPGSEIVEGDYQVNKRWSVSLTRDEVGGVSVDGKYHTKF